MSPTQLFDGYLEALNPDSLLEVIPRDVLQVMMAGFFYSDRVGMTLLYEQRSGAAPLGPVYATLNPDYGPTTSIETHWNPFCRAFREKPDWNKLCEQCDLRRAAKV
ncbi:MAG TPA: hypothetical protein VNT99_10780, partial [Methylomirabilota bacterium]|nr:hypothetical protein [Methylomirabilota bacterium]